MVKLRLDRLFSYPRTRVLSREGDVTRVQIEGLVCSSVCAVRSRQTLARLPGVRRIDIDFASGIATIVGTTTEPAAYQRAIDSVIAGKPIRRALDRLRRSGGDEKAAA
jgi:hypothetical protein